MDRKKSISPLDDGLSALQLPILQSSEISRFLSSSKDWTNEQDTTVFEDTENSPIDFFGHYGHYSSSVNAMYGNGQYQNELGSKQSPAVMSPGFLQTPNYPAGTPDGFATPSSAGQHQQLRNPNFNNRPHPHQSFNEPSQHNNVYQQLNQPYPYGDDDMDGHLQSFFGPIDANGNGLTNPITDNHRDPKRSDTTATFTEQDEQFDSLMAIAHPIKPDPEDETSAEPPHRPAGNQVIHPQAGGGTSLSSIPRSWEEEEEIRKFINSSQFLHFLPETQESVIYDQRGNTITVNIGARLYGNFFLSQPTGARPSAISPAASTTSDSGTPNSSLWESLQKYELTFYRRNLFQVTASVSNAQHAAYAGNSENPMLRSRILSLGMSVGVTGTDDKKPTKLLYCPPKAAGTTTAEEGADLNDSKRPPEIEPVMKSIYPKNSGYDEVVDWKRLQFRTATAHNGRKKLQNYFSVWVTLYAELENGRRVNLATASSRPIVVRGRNPRFYQNRDNITLVDGNNSNREVGGAIAKIPTINAPSAIPGGRPTKPEESVDAPRGDFEGSYPPDPESDAAPVVVHGKVMHFDHEAYDRKQNGNKDLQAGAESKALPKNKKRDSRDSTASRYPQQHVKSTELEGTVKYSDETSRTETEEPLSEVKSKGDEDYEYFAMPLNYWLPPVEVVYRPHAVHHPLKFPRGKSQAMIDNSKRYFSQVE